MAQTTLPPPDVSSNGQVGMPREADLTRPALSAGSYWGLPSVSQTLDRLRDDAECEFGDDLYDWMDKDPIAGGSRDVLKNFTLSRPLQLLPNRRPGPAQVIDDPRLQDEFDTSARIRDYCLWCQERLDRPVDGTDGTLAEFCETAWGHGNQLADEVWRQVPRAEFGGKLPASGPSLLALESIDHKPRSSWAYVVDEFMKVKGILARTPSTAGGGYGIYRTDKFAIATWGARKSDPRGSSIYRRAVRPWNVRSNTWPDLYKFGQRFGEPAPLGKLDTSGSTDIYLKRDDLGGKSIADVFLADLLNWRNGQAMVMRSGDDVQLRESESDGRAFRFILDMARMEIVLAILLQVSATQEAQFDSRAKADSGMDVLGSILRGLRRWTCRLWEWQVLYRIVLFNWGKAIADRHTPIASLGEVEHQDTIAMLSALGSVGYRLTPSMLPQWDAEIGGPIRQPGEASIAIGSATVPQQEQEETGAEAA